MSTRRLLWVMIGVLSTIVVVSGAGVAALLLFQVARPTEQLLVIGEGSLSLVDSGGRGRVIADDANRDFRYPILSPDGARVAYISLAADGATLYVLRLSDGERTAVYTSGESQPFYMTWSPDGEHISFLSGQADGSLTVRVVAADGSREPDLISTAVSSSYFAWRPDSSALLLHSGGAASENGRVAAYTPGTAQPIVELADPGIFKTPAWSADGTQFFYVAQPATQGTAPSVESVLTRVSPDGATQILASEQQAAMLFARAPATDDIAYITVNEAGYGPLKLVDAAGGATRVISREDEQIPAFFWSPSGDQIAYLTLEQQEGAPRLTWHVVGVDGGPIRDLSSFVPSRAFIALLTYFDAYAFSFDLWSAQSDKLVYGTDDGIYVLDVPSGEAARRSDGGMATWVGRR